MNSAWPVWLHPFFKAHLRAGFVLFTLVDLFLSGVYATEMPTKYFLYQRLTRLSDYRLIDSRIYGIRPYSRFHFASMINEAYLARERIALNSLAQLVLEEVIGQFIEEFQIFDEKGVKTPETHRFGLRTHSLTIEYDLLTSKRSNLLGDIEGYSQPFVQPKEGRNYLPGNILWLEGLYWLNLDYFAALVYEPRIDIQFPFDASNTLHYTTNRLYGRFCLFNHALLVGKEEVRWGQLSHGELILGGTVRPLGLLDNWPLVKFGNDIPWRLSEIDGLPFAISYQIFYSLLDQQRFQFRNARLIGVKVALKPLKTLEIGGAQLYLFGGSETDNGTVGKIAGGLLGIEDGSSISAARLFGLDFRADLYRLIEIYGEVAINEDVDNNENLSFFGENFSMGSGGRLANFLLDGKVDIAAEYVRTAQGLYTDDVQISGFTYYHRTLGSPLGPNAWAAYLDLAAHARKDVDLDLTFFFERRNALSLSEHLVDNMFAGYSFERERSDREDRIGALTRLTIVLTGHSIFGCEFGYGRATFREVFGGDELANIFYFGLSLTLLGPELKGKES